MQAKQLQSLGTVTMLLALLVPCGMCLFYLNWQPRLDEDQYAWLAESSAPTSTGLALTWLGRAGVYLSDGDTKLLIDPFFSRPALTRIVLGELRPDPERIRSALKRAGIDEVDAVIVTHAHFDHALDAPWLAEHFDALFVGSPSAANLARGQGLAEPLIREVGDATQLRLGEFRLRFPRSEHAPLPPLLAQLSGVGRSVERPLRLPASAQHFRQGPLRALHVVHPQGRVLIHGSAGFDPDALAQRDADLVLTSVAGLSYQSQDYQENFVQRGVTAVEPEWVVPMDWDDVTRPVSEQSPPPPLLLDNTPAALRQLDDKLEESGTRMQLTRPLRRLRLVTTDNRTRLNHDPVRRTAPHKP